MIDCRALSRLIEASEHDVLEITDATGITSTTIERHTQGVELLSLIDAVRLADFFGVSVDVVIGRCDPPVQDDDSLFGQNLDVMDLSPRSFNALWYHGRCRTVGDVIKIAREGKLRDIDKVGRHSAEEICNQIFKMTEEDLFLRNARPK